MNEEKLLSVIVPVYRVEPYLRRCVDSIRNQTYKHLQIILVDDGSPDRCGEICDAYAEMDERIIAVHQKNGGRVLHVIKAFSMRWGTMWHLWMAMIGYILKCIKH